MILCAKTLVAALAFAFCGMLRTVLHVAVEAPVAWHAARLPYSWVSV